MTGVKTCFQAFAAVGMLTYVSFEGLIDRQATGDVATLILLPRGEILGYRYGLRAACRGFYHGQGLHVCETNQSCLGGCVN